jgi:5-methylcytosine-specific restriction endonuclease McrA
MIMTIKDFVKGKPYARRDRRWPRVRREHLKKEPRCRVCNGKRKREVHHVVPVHIDRSLELAPGNLITLCESKRYGINCHLLVGHRGNYRKSNPDCRAMADNINNYLEGK